MEVAEPIADCPPTPHATSEVEEIKEVFICPICLHNCEGKQEFIEHYYGYCPKTRKFFGIVEDAPLLECNLELE